MKTYTINARNFGANFIQALKSGIYKQNRCGLTANGGYCFLGVVCKIFNIADDDIRFRQWIPRNNPKFKHIPKEIQGNGTESELARVLSELNDKKMLSFTEIADWIEQNVEFI